ncbi:MAG: hypothetical protein KDK33_20745 [Leptospiraceae bacterium]|nr:hypothetical protein [Leptospiraceae bacterium]
MSVYQLEATRHAITITIKQRKLVLDEFGPELDAGYVAFARAELKSLILIRRAIIDEAATR